MKSLCFSHSLYQIVTANKDKAEQINPYRNLIPAPKLESPEFHSGEKKMPFKSSGLKGSQYLSSDLNISSWDVKHPLKVSLTSVKGSLGDENRKGLAQSDRKRLSKIIFFSIRSSHTQNGT